MKCRFDLNAQYKDAVTKVRTALEGIDGEYRTPCEEQVDAFTTFLTTFEATFAEERANWQLYVDGKPYPKLQQVVNRVSTMAGEFRDEQLPALADACYTKADIKEAQQAEADTSEIAKTDDAKTDGTKGDA